nr:helix-turn-helix transcriptional regulator [Streptomyces sp. SID3343]
MGLELRRHREAAGATLDDAALRLECHKTKISRIENGRSGVRARDVRELLALYGVSDADVQAFLEALAKSGAKRGWWQKYGPAIPSAYADLIDLEAAATHIRTFQTILIPGLLQTESYSRAVHASNPAAIDPATLEVLLEVRAARQDVLAKTSPVTRFEAIIFEAAIRTPVGSREIMRDQLERLLEVGESPNIELQILPMAVGAHAGMSGPFVIFKFPLPADGDVVFLENLTSSLYVETLGETEFYTLVYDKLRSAALNPKASIAAIRAAISQFDRGE